MNDTKRKRRYGTESVNTPPICGIGENGFSEAAQ